MAKSNSFSLDQSDFLPAAATPSSEAATSDPLKGRRMLRNVAQIDLERIVARSQVRQEFDPEKLQELADSLQSKGQQQPIRVYWDEVEQGDGRYVVLQGERRLRAAHLAGLTSLQAVVHEGELTPAEITELQLVENIIRDQLNPLEEAKAFRQIMDDRSAATGVECTAKDLAQEIGLSASKVARSVRLLTLPEDVQQDVAAGRLPTSMLREVIKLKTEDEQREAIRAYKAGETYSQVVQAVKAKRDASTGGPQTKETFCVGSIQLQATARDRVGLAEIAAALEQWAGELRGQETAA